MMTKHRSENAPPIQVASRIDMEEEKGWKLTPIFISGEVAHIPLAQLIAEGKEILERGSIPPSKHFDHGLSADRREKVVDRLAVERHALPKEEQRRFRELACAPPRSQARIVGVVLVS